jgi:hypothetical protein
LRQLGRIALARLGGELRVVSSTSTDDDAALLVGRDCARSSADLAQGLEVFTS